MSRLGILGATALSLSLAVATPALAQQVRGSGAGAVRAGNVGSVHTGGNTGGAASFRGAQANVGGANFAGRGAQVTQGGGAQFTQERSGGQFAQGVRGDRDGRFGRGAGFAAGLAVGSAWGYGGYYDPYYYGDDYAYNDYYDGDYDPGYVVQPGVAVSSAGDASYCAQRYRSYDPATGTYLGFDGLRHPCL